MFKRSFKTPLTGLFTLIVSTACALSPASAAERVAVSVAPLHSLVSNLLAGVDEPTLLFANPKQRHNVVPEHSELAKIDSAKMVVWVGPGFETALANLKTIDPAVSLKGLTLSSSTPLLGAPDANNPHRSSGIADMRFWLDPRLAKVAVGRIAPNLVRLYPDHVEQILDNEIDLKKRLMKMEHHFRHALDTPIGVPLDVPKSDILYLAWRFNLNVPNCPTAAAKVDHFSAAPGRKHYFQMMDAILADLKACQI